MKKLFVILGAFALSFALVSATEPVKPEAKKEEVKKEEIKKNAL